MRCDICSAPGSGTIVRAGDVSAAVRRGFNAMTLRLVPEYFAGMYTDEHAKDRADKWAQSAISGSSSQSDWNVCSRCMTSLSKFLSAPAQDKDTKPAAATQSYPSPLSTTSAQIPMQAKASKPTERKKWWQIWK